MPAHARCCTERRKQQSHMKKAQGLRGTIHQVTAMWMWIPALHSLYPIFMSLKHAKFSFSHLSANRGVPPISASPPKTAALSPYLSCPSLYVHEPHHVLLEVQTPGRLACTAFTWVAEMITGFLDVTCQESIIPFSPVFSVTTCCWQQVSAVSAG